MDRSKSSIIYCYKDKKKTHSIFAESHCGVVTFTSPRSKVLLSFIVSRALSSVSASFIATFLLAFCLLADMFVTFRCICGLSRVPV